ncbi:MAG: DUF11 domain-containing protein, partial [Actinomycetota bacterium]
EASQGVYDESTSRWSVGELASGDSATLNVRVVVRIEGALTNTVTVSSDAPDPDPSNNTASATVMASDQPLPSTGSSGQRPIVAGSIAALLLGAGLLLIARRRRRPVV